MNVMPEAVFQGQCNVCGWVSGIQALNARVAIATENFQPWSLQNIILCNREGKACAGTHQNHVGRAIAKNMDYVIHKSASPFIKSRCANNNNCTCLNATNSPEHAKLRDIQWYFVGPVISARTSEEVEIGLQSGPLTTCFVRVWGQGRKAGNHCKDGCAHANSIVGYDDQYWYLQESIGRGFKYPPGYAKGRFQLKNGTWYVKRDSECADAVLRRATYTLVFYDYDKANAYFTKETVKEDELSFIDKKRSDVEERDFSNIGMAKRRCSLMGVNCKGVVKLSDGSAELVKEITSTSSNSPSIEISRKVQMVVYLRHSSGDYIGVKVSKKAPKLIMVSDKTSAAPFFLHKNMFVSFLYPNLHIGQNGQLTTFEGKKAYLGSWQLQDTNLRNIASGKSMHVTGAGKIVGKPYKKDSDSQRFNLYFSGEWSIKSKSLGKELVKNKDDSEVMFGDITKKFKSDAKLRWQARQILTNKGKPFNPTWKLGKGYFKLEESDNQVSPTDTLIMNTFDRKYLGVQSNKIKPVSDDNDNSRWTFEYGDL